MSYILDALKRADAQRDRGQVPGLGTQPATAVPVPRAGLAPWLWLGGVLAVAAGGLALWRMNAATPPPSTPAPVAQAAPAQVTAPAPAPVAAPAPVPARPPAPARAVAPPPPARPKPPAAAPAVPAAPAAVASAPAPAAAAPRVLALAELPENLRNGLPKLAVSGSVYSANASQRMLIVNGQVFNEGGALAPDLLLESIGARGAVLNFRGTRFRLDY